MKQLLAHYRFQVKIVKVGRKEEKKQRKAAAEKRQKRETYKERIFMYDTLREKEREREIHRSL